MNDNREDLKDLENLEENNTEDTQETESKGKKSKLKGQEKKAAQEIEELNKKNEELKDKYLRVVAEYDNYRRRTAKEKIEISDNVKSSLMLDFIPIVDDMDRAVQFLDEKTTDEMTTDIVDGIKLISHKLREFLRNEGVEEIDAKDKDFDTDLHEAVTNFSVENENLKGKVIDVIQKGYTLNGKVIRFAKVVVGE